MKLETYAVLDELGIPRAATVEIPADLNVPVELPFGFPVVVKILSAEILHKSDVGGVLININNESELHRAIQHVNEQVRLFAPAVTVNRIAIQPMYAGVGEVLIGYRRDPKVGPIIMVAAGGELAEIYRDRSLRIAPVNSATAQEMIDEVRSLSLLKGFRSRPSGDIAALLEAIVAFSQLAQRADVAEAEINPLLVRAQSEGVVAVDALAWIG